MALRCQAWAHLEGRVRGCRCLRCASVCMHVAHRWWGWIAEERPCLLQFTRAILIPPLASTSINEHLTRGSTCGVKRLPNVSGLLFAEHPLRSNNVTGCDRLEQAVTGCNGTLDYVQGGL